MKTKFAIGFLTIIFSLLFTLRSFAQDLGPHFKKIKDGIYVYAGQTNEANVTIIQSQEGILLIDTGQTPKDSHIVMAALKKLALQPVRYIYIPSPIQITRWKILFFRRQRSSSHTKAPPSR